MAAPEVPLSTGTRFRVAICGAGIGGLTCALALSRYPDIQIDIYESASKLAEIGAGIGLFSRPWSVMQKLGVDQELLKYTNAKPSNTPVSSFKYRKSDGPEGFEFYTLVTNGPLLTFHRADFQQVLLRRLPRTCRTYYSKRLRSYTQRASGTIDLSFEDGSSATCDVLIGADGLKSAVRKTLQTFQAQRACSEGRYKEEQDHLLAVDPTWSGQIAYRSVIPTDQLRARYPGHRVLEQQLQYLGKNAFVIAYPMSNGKLINFVAFVMRHDLENTIYQGPWVSTSSKEKFAPQFSDWEPEVQALVDCAENPLKWAIHTVHPLSSFASGGAALIGDAAHAMTPHQGSGAGQAMEDAFILATLLGHPRTTRGTISRALKVYDEIRRPFAHTAPIAFGRAAPGMAPRAPRLPKPCNPNGIRPKVVVGFREVAALNTITRYLAPILDGPARCQTFFQWQEIGLCIQVITVHAILQLRLYALYESSKLVLVFFAFLAAAEAAVMGVLIGYPKEGLVLTNEPSPGLFICADADPYHSPWIAFNWTTALIVETILLVMSMYKAWSFHRTGGYGSLVRRLTKDSAVYFFYMFWVYLANCVLWFVNKITLTELGTGFFFGVCAILSHRVLISVRAEHYDLDLSYEATPSLRFRHEFATAQELETFAILTGHNEDVCSST
ncbi:hypothetical protein HGRIS_005302 [Hohenbuehelia grisea]|uniref:FAD-binding domain-containing protein n=1 Tax=Hohenbuehelia grisea TaxID=104357 RepID=A0ABR3JEN6_9AGAR